MCSGTAHAQFWKRWTGQEERSRPKTIVRPAVQKSNAREAGPSASADPAPDRKKREERRSETIFKERYRVDVLAQLYLNELVVGGKPVYKNHIPDKTLPGLNFYQGIKLAADTLRMMGYHLEIYFHDIADPANSVPNLISKKKLDSSDLVIGAVNAAQIPALADFAKQHKINFVSALSPSDANVSDNPSFHLLQPTLERHCEALRETIAKKARRKTVIVYHRSKVPLDEECFNLMTESEFFNFDTVNCNEIPDANKLRALFDSTETNYVVIPVMQGSYASDLLQQLHNKFPQYRFEVFGMPSWKGMDVLRKVGSIDNVGITVTAPFYFDPSSSAGLRFSESYDRVFGGKPGELAFRGYEAMYWYAYLLSRYGTRFQEHYGDSGAAPFTRFDMKLQKDDNDKTKYYENSHVYQYRYQGGSFSVEQ
jgi:hypothetical protein